MCGLSVLFLLPAMLFSARHDELGRVGLLLAETGRDQGAPSRPLQLCASERDYTRCILIIDLLSRNKNEGLYVVVSSYTPCACAEGHPYEFAPELGARRAE